MATYIWELIYHEKQYEICRAYIAVHMDLHILYFQQVIYHFNEETKFTQVEHLSNRAGRSRIDIIFGVWTEQVLSKAALQDV